MSNSNSNSFRQVGAGKNFLSPTDFIIQVDTSAGAVTLVLPKIATILSTYITIQQFIGVRFVDISNNASVNNITIEGFETDLINSNSTIVLNTNGVGGFLTLLGAGQWSFQQNSLTTSSSSVIEIPKLQVKSDGFVIGNPVEQVYFQFLPVSNLDFLNYNPRIFLFRYKTKKNRLVSVPDGSNYREIAQSKGWHHPSNNNGANYPNAKLYGGGQYDNLGNILPSRNTEFPIPSNAIPYTKIPADLSILTYYGIQGTNTILTESDFPISITNPLWTNYTLKAVGGYNSRRYNLRLAFCIAIDNPTGDVNNPVLFGEMSYPIFYQFQFDGINITGLRFAYGTQNYGKI